jgi:uncharacterized protein (DUF427 family)
MDAQTAGRAPGFAAHPEHSITIEPSPKRVRAFVGDTAIADSTDALLLRESRHMPVYYFPRRDVRMDLLAPTDHHTHCPFKGDASYWTIKADGKTLENAVWGYERPFDEMAAIQDCVAFYWDRLDRRLEEDEEVFGHPRDPYHRVDVRESARRVRVVLNGETIADSRRALFVFETGLRTRYYLPPEDVRTELLTPTATRTYCPYKGGAHYWSATVGGKRYDDIVWSYPEPLPEQPRLKGRLCFYDEKVDVLEVARD